MVYPLITLYSPTETSFTTNGLGSLAEANSCVVTEEANGSYELEMVYPISGKRYKDIVNRSIILAKPNPSDQAQPFRIYEISRPMNGLVTFYAAHISYDLSGYPLKPFEAESAAAAIAGLKSNSIVNHPFTFWTDKGVGSKFKLPNPLSTRSALAGVKGSILDTYGGEYKFDRFLVQLYVNRGYDRGVVIRYGKNLTDLNQEEKCTKVYTGVYPYWLSYEGNLVELPELYVPTEGTYNFTNILTLDCSSDFDNEPTIEQLRTRAQNYIKNNDIGKPTVSLKVSFAQLEQTEEYKHLSLLEHVELFDTVTVEFPEMNVSSTAKVTQTVYDVMAGRYKSVTVGSVRAGIADTIMGQDADIDRTLDEAASEHRKAIENATKWIVNGRGYMVAVRDEDGRWMEICSLDTPNIDTAMNVWRWNNGGFGFSSHGYNGPYETAITQDGAIVANFITTGSLTASLLKAGILQDINGGETFYLDLEAGVLKMNATAFSIGGKTVEDISEGVAKTQAKEAVDAQTQKQIFDKLTNGGQTQGLYLDNGLLYINAEYIQTGKIVDKMGKNSWDLNTGQLIAGDIQAFGSFRCGSTSSDGYYILLEGTEFQGYTEGRKVGYIDFSAKSYDVDTLEQFYGLQLQSEGIIRISTPRIAVAATSDVSVLTEYGLTGTFFQAVHFPRYEGNNEINGYYDGWFTLRFVNGLLVEVTYPNYGGTFS